MWAGCDFVVVGGWISFHDYDWDESGVLGWCGGIGVWLAAGYWWVCE